jgi:hypothetical protein
VGLRDADSWSPPLLLLLATPLPTDVRLLQQQHMLVMIQEEEELLLLSPAAVVAAASLPVRAG